MPEKKSFMSGLFTTAENVYVESLVRGDLLRPEKICFKICFKMRISNLLGTTFFQQTGIKSQKI